VPTYTLNLSIFSLLNASTADFQIFADGAQLGSNLTVLSSGTNFSSAVSYSGAFPSSLEFKFFDSDLGTVDQIEVRSVLINNRHINTSNFLSVSVLSDTQTAVIDVNSAALLFNSSEPEISVFTVGATQSFSAGVDEFRSYAQSTPQIFDTGADNDFIWTGAGDDKISGGSGNDYLRTGSGNDLINGGSGDDRLFGDSGNDIIYGGIGVDKINGGSGNDTLVGGTGNDNLVGNTGDDILIGEGGNDRLNGGNGNDNLYGDMGIDRLLGGIGEDVLDGGVGNDVLLGGANDDIIYGGDNNDIIVGGKGNDILYGNDGSDQFIFGKNGSFGYIDTIEDFIRADDVIDISGILSGININFLNVSSYIEADTTNLELSVDVTGSGTFTEETKIIEFSAGTDLANATTMWFNGEIIV